MAQRRKSRSLEEVSNVGPEKAGALLADLTADTESTIGQIAQRHGLKASTVSNFLNSLRTTHLAAYEEFREVASSELLPMIDTRAKQVLSFMSPQKMEEASVRDLSVALGVLMEKRALLRGEPTQIMSMDDRQALREMLPVVLREANRRGMIVEGEYHEEEGDVEGSHRVISTDTTTDYAPDRSMKITKPRTRALGARKP